MWEKTGATSGSALMLLHLVLFFGRSAFTLSIVTGSNYHQGHEFVLFMPACIVPDNRAIFLSLKFGKQANTCDL